MSHPQDVQPTKIHGDVERLVQANRTRFFRGPVERNLEAA